MPSYGRIKTIVSGDAMTVEAESATALAATRLRAPQGAALRVVDGMAETLLVAALLGELSLVLANVLARAYLHHSFLWADEAARLALSTLAFIGGAVAYRRRDHAFVRVIVGLLSRRVQGACF